MSSSKIRYVFSDSPALQNGLGTPDHIGPLGSIYVDYNEGIAYINKNGISLWNQILDNPVDYIHFNSGLTTTYNGGDLFWDDDTDSLAYKPYTINNDVTVNLGQETLIRVFNQTGSQINNGKVVTITGATSSTPTVSLAIASDGGNTLYKVAGVATHDIPNNSYGFITQFGNVNDINLTGFQLGQVVYLSQTSAGDFVSFSGVNYTGRTAQVGVVLNNSISGRLKVSIINEIPFSNITQLEANILNANNSSTGVFEFSGISKTSNTTFSVAPAKGWIVNNATNPTSPTLKYVNYSGATNIDSPYRTTNTITYILLTSGSTLMMQPTVPTPQQRRQNIFLGKIGHPDKTNFSIAFQVVDYDISPVSQLRDMFTPIPLINNGIYPYPNANLTFNNTAGTLYGLGINFPVDSLNPNSISVSAQTPVSFQYRTQTGGTLTTTTLVDPAYYDNAGVRTIIPAPAKQATNQRVFLLQDGSFRVQYGQTVYTDLTTALSSVQTETFTTFPNWRDNGILIAILSLRSDTTNLADTNQAKFLFVSKFGESVGAAGGLSTTNLQQAYNNSTNPEIIINSTLDGLSIQNGTGNADNITKLIEGINTAGQTTSFIRADGDISGTTLQTNGFIANNNGLTATTISATTYQNLPTDVSVTGGTYSSGGTATFTNNTGGTFTVTGFTQTNYWSSSRTSSKSSHYCICR